MGVEVLGEIAAGNGHEDSMEVMRTSHFATSRILINLAMGRKKNDPTPPYDPEHVDNKWPVMVYHAGKGEKVVGVSLVGLKDNDRKAQAAANRDALKALFEAGYRMEPFIKPQIAVLDPAAEKKALLDKNAELEGKLIALADTVAKMQEKTKADA